MLRSFPTEGGKFQTGKTLYAQQAIRLSRRARAGMVREAENKCQGSGLANMFFRGVNPVRTAGRTVKPSSLSLRRGIGQVRIPPRNSEQLLDYRSGGERWNGTAAVIKEVHVRIDSQDLEHRVMDVCRGDRSVMWDFSQTVG